MKKITSKELWSIFGGSDLGWSRMSNGFRLSWDQRAEAINSRIHTPDSDEQSNECPIPTIQEDA